MTYYTLHSIWVGNWTYVVPERRDLPNRLKPKYVSCSRGIRNDKKAVVRGKVLARDWVRPLGLYGVHKFETHTGVTTNTAEKSDETT